MATDLQLESRVSDFVIHAPQVFRILSESSELVEKLQSNVVQFRTQMKALGFTMSGADTHAIAPVSWRLVLTLLCSHRTSALLSVCVFTLLNDLVT